MKIVLLVLLLTGCATPYIAQMTPEQIAAYAKVKEAGWGCIRGVYAGAVISTTWGNTDKGIIGTLSTDGDCKFTFTGPPLPAPKP